MTIYSYEEALQASIAYFDGDELAGKVVVDKYLLRNSNNELIEKTPDDMHRRIAKEFARIEEKKFAKPLTEDEIFSYLQGFKKIIPQGSPMYGIGNTNQYITLSNCYVLDPPEDSYTGIHWTDEQISHISKRRGGCGIDISKLRPNGTYTRNSSRTSTGIIPFMERFSNSIREVGQGGRRGALMLTLSVHHPEVLDFATVKNDLKKVTGANISIRLTDEFLRAVVNGEEYEQRWPVEAAEIKVRKQTDARAVWKEIIKNAHAMAEPGLLFWDNIIRNSPADCYADFGFGTVSTNPCVVGNTLVFTDHGVKEVKELLNSEFTSIVNGEFHNSTNKGFWSNGYKDVYKVTTDKGFTFETTDNHKIHTPYGWSELKDLYPGCVISLANHRALKDWEGEGTESEGWLLGNLLGDGHFSENSAVLQFWEKDKEIVHDKAVSYINNCLDHRSDLGERYNLERNVLSVKSTYLKTLSNKYNLYEDKKICSDIEKTSKSFYKGFLRGWFDADGTVNVDDKKGNSIRLSSISIGNLEIAQRMLLKLGIVSSLYKDRKDAGFRLLPDGKGGLKLYWCQANHELHLSKDNLEIFYKEIGFDTPYKQEQLKSIIDNRKRKPNKENFTDSIKSIEYSGIKEVFDCTINNVHEFDGNGIRLHNCSELPLSALDSCRLLLINLYTYVKNPFTENSYFDYDEFYDDVKIAQRLMDDLVDLEVECVDRILEKIKNDPESAELKAREVRTFERIRENCLNGRRTGTGITALGDTLAALGIKYDSDLGLDTTEKIYMALKLGAYESSIEMAEELGPFPVWDHKLEYTNQFLLRFKDDFLSISDDRVIYGKDLLRRMSKVGRRNISLLTTAPAGTVSILTQTSSGIEPVYQTSYFRKKKGNHNDEHFRVDFTDANGDQWMEFKVYHPKVNEWMRITGETDETKSPWYGSCANDLDWKQRVYLQARANKHVDHAISSTLNLPKDVTVDKVAEIYETAWKAGCKGITVYRDGCRDGVLTTESAKAKEEITERPKAVDCDIHHVTVKGKQYFVLVGKINEKPYEVFAGKNGFLDKEYTSGIIIRQKKGFYKLVATNKDLLMAPITQASTEEEETVTRLASLALQSDVSVHKLVQQLEKVNGELHGFAKAISRVLKKYIPDGTEEQGESCPTCKAKPVVRQEGCVTCKSCGWSKCL